MLKAHSLVSLLVLLVACAFALGACGDEAAPPKPGHEAAEPDVVTLALGEDREDRRPWYLRVTDLAILRESNHGGHGANFDLHLEFEPSVTGSLWIRCNGTRNLIHVGRGSEQAFQHLADSGKAFDLSTLPAAAEAAGLELAKGGIDYWTPTKITAAPGTVLLARSRGPDSGRASAVIFVRPRRADGRFELVVRRAPGEAKD